IFVCNWVGLMGVANHAAAFFRRVSRCQTIRCTRRATRTNQTTDQQQGCVRCRNLFPALLCSFSEPFVSRSAVHLRAGSHHEVHVLGVQVVHEIVVPLVTVVVAWFIWYPGEITSGFDGQDDFPVVFTSKGFESLFPVPRMRVRS